MSATTLNNSSTKDQSQSRSMPDIWQILVGGLGVVSVIALIIYLLSAISFLNRPFIGAMPTSTLAINAGQQAGDIAWPGQVPGELPEGAVLANYWQRGDRIIEINGESLYPTEALTDYATARNNFTTFLNRLNLNDDVQVSFTVLRNGGETGGCEDAGNGLSRCIVTVSPLSGLPGIDFLAYFFAPFVAALILLTLGFIIARYKFDTKEGVMAAAIAFSTAIYTGGLFDVGTQAAFVPGWIIGTCSLAATMLIFGLNFPRRLSEIRRAAFVDYIIFALAGLVAAYLVYGFYYPADALQQMNTFTPFTTSIGALGVLGLWAIAAIQRRRATNPIIRDQANSLFIGTSLMLAPVLLWFGTRFAGAFLPDNISLVPFNLEALVILTIFPVSATAYAVLEYDAVDTEHLTRRGMTYGIMLAALIGSMYLITLGGSMVFIDIFNANSNVTLIAIILFVMVLFFTPLRNFLQTRIDRIYYREQHDLQAKVQEFNRRLTSLNDYEEIIDYFYRSVKDILTPGTIYVFLHERADSDYLSYQVNGTTTDIRFTADSPLVSVLMNEDNHLITVGAGEKWPHALRIDQPRLNLLKAQTIAGLPGSDNLNGFVILTAPANKNHYNYDEIMFFSDVASQLAIATERSQVIGTLERRVQELDVLSQVGQAVNFTIELDDLLELIYNQTSKLLPVPNFYIVLYEENINRLYFAFFLEGDDRFDNKENVRWIMGVDLFSEIVKTNNAIRVNNFTVEMNKRAADLPLVDSGLLAWMGVPLTAGHGTLGVMAAGKRRDTSDYTDEQFKIFSDVAALAATSLDKANLFNQTRIRQRQLTVLNDISRQLVATETDVEKLLSIIMSSAVEILNAEAGSLLLNTEDETGDLEFRVVIGGGGDELLKTRIPAGQGVVGKVVSSNEPIIVNDAESDPRHSIEVIDDFISRSLLAVPLTAKDEVIGVLEVINKKDGTPFIEEDANLLTTFASQAAVAIENARLFQQTDAQLSQRVKELEALERMDAQLNRTLDLSEVAGITVRQAMDILGANAGALGIVHENPPYLEIVAIEGYKREEYPVDAEGEDGLIWQLNSGVVKRVMRSRQADITMDVTIDPDYDNGLTDSNSQITLPMITGDEINAILILEKNTMPRFSLPDWGFAQRIAEHASVSIANAQFTLALNQANESQSEFMGFAAHEMKTPLASVKGYAEVMLSGMTGELSEQQETFLQTIQSNAVRMNTIIEDLRDTAKMKIGEFTVDAEPMNIRPAVIETLRPFITVLEASGQTLINNVPENLPLIWGDEGRIIQVLTNLITNANKYSEADTSITISAWIDEDYHDQRGEKRGRMLTLSVKDEGFGMSEADQSKLFKERYFRSTNQQALDKPGTGLGMMLTKGIMDGHQGEIWMESTLGEGSVFFISFPLAEDMEKSLKIAGD